jgi:D-alanyl-D-alanine carboxypeptidase
MQSISSRTAALLVVLSSGLWGCSSSDTHEGPVLESTEGQLDAAAIVEIEALADDAVAAGIPGVSIAIQRGSQTVTIARGVADRAAPGRLTPEHRFRAASVAKSLLASVILQLVDEGRVALTDTVEEWLPAMVPQSGAVTIEQLVRQQSGIFDYGADPRLMQPYMAGDFGYYWSPEKLVELANEHGPTFEPGARYEYSNTNFTLLGLIIEKATGETLANVVRDRIFEPVGMTSSKMETSSHMDSPYAHGYLVGLAEEPIDVTDMSASAVFGSGNLVSTPLDLSRFYQALVAGDVVSEEQLPAMFTVDPSVPGNRYGMGVFRFENVELYPCGTFVGHDGGIPGYDTAAYSSLDGKRQFAVAVSSFTLDEKAGDEAAHAAFARLNEAIACL